jgi:hypothetical protein
MGSFLKSVNLDANKYGDLECVWIFGTWCFSHIQQGLKLRRATPVLRRMRVDVPLFNCVHACHDVSIDRPVTFIFMMFVIIRCLHFEKLIFNLFYDDFVADFYYFTCFYTLFHLHLVLAQNMNILRRASMQTVFAMLLMHAIRSFAELINYVFLQVEVNKDREDMYENGGMGRSRTK